MRNILTGIFILLAFVGFGQTFPSQRPIGSKNELLKNGGGFISDSGLMVAVRDTTNHPARGYNGALTVWQGALWLRDIPKWVKLAQLSSIQDTANLSYRIDTLSNLVLVKLNASDTANLSLRIDTLALKQGDYIPLAGTVPGKPVTGSIEVEENAKNIWGRGPNYPDPESYIALNFYENNIDIETHESGDIKSLGMSGYGINATQDNTPYYSPNSYIQKTYADHALDSAYLDGDSVRYVRRNGQTFAYFQAQGLRVAPLDSLPGVANGIGTTGSTILPQSATTTVAGLVNTSNQALTGDKSTIGSLSAINGAVGSNIFSDGANGYFSSSQNANATDYALKQTAGGGTTLNSKVFPIDFRIAEAQLAARLQSGGFQIFNGNFVNPSMTIGGLAAGYGGVWNTVAGVSFNVAALVQGPTGDTYLNAKGTGNELHFRINNVEKMILKDDGRVGIGTLLTPAASAIFDAESPDKGVVFPRMSGSTQNAIASPVAGLLLYNTDSLAYCFYNGTAWRIIGGGLGGSGSVTIGTTGTDINSTVANPTTTPVITLNVPDASATARGALTTADWATFNGKQDALSTFTAGSVIFSDGTNLAENNADLFWDNVNGYFGLGTNTPSQKMDVLGNINFRAWNGSSYQNGYIGSNTPDGIQGMYLHPNDDGSDSLEIYNKDVPAIKVSRDNYVMIGLGTPTEKLEIEGVTKSNGGFKTTWANGSFQAGTDYINSNIRRFNFQSSGDGVEFPTTNYVAHWANPEEFIGMQAGDGTNSSNLYMQPSLISSSVNDGTFQSNIQVSPNELFFDNSNPSSRGIASNYDYTGNVTPFDFIQSKYATDRFVSLTGSYANPLFIASLDYAKLTSAPTIPTVNINDSRILFSANGAIKDTTILSYNRATQSVGIGIANPTAQLHTTGTVTFAGIGTNTVDTKIITTNATGNITTRTTASFGFTQKFFSANVAVPVGNIVVTHNLNLATPRAIVVSFRDSTTGETVTFRITAFTANSITITSLMSVTVDITIIG